MTDRAFVAVAERRPGDWHGSGDVWWSVPERMRGDPNLSFGSLVALPPSLDYPEGNIGWVRWFAADMPEPTGHLDPIVRVIPPGEWDRHGFRNGLFYLVPLEPAWPA